jgi:hypothetical protein
MSFFITIRNHIRQYPRVTAILFTLGMLAGVVLQSFFH